MCVHTPRFYKSYKMLIIALQLANYREIDHNSTFNIY